MEVRLSKRNGKGNGRTIKSFVKGEQYIILKGLLAFRAFWKTVGRISDGNENESENLYK